MFVIVNVFPVRVEVEEGREAAVQHQSTRNAKLNTTRKTEKL